MKDSATNTDSHFQKNPVFRHARNHRPHPYQHFNRSRKLTSGNYHQQGYDDFNYYNNQVSPGFNNQWNNYGPYYQGPHPQLREMWYKGMYVMNRFFDYFYDMGF